MTIELLESLAVIITPLISAAQTVIVWWGIRAMIAANRERVAANAEANRQADQQHAEASRQADQRHTEASRQADQRHAEAMEALRQQGEDAARRHEETIAGLKALIERNR